MITNEKKSQIESYKLFFLYFHQSLNYLISMKDRKRKMTWFEKVLEKAEEKIFERN